MALWSLNRRLGRRHLAHALAAGHFLKAGNADLTLQPALKMGFRPRVILSYRRLEPIVASFLMRSSYATVDMILNTYLRSMRNGLAAVSLFGGCVISFEELQSLSDIAWVRPLATLCGLDPKRILAARNRLTRPVGPERHLPCFSLEAEALWREAEALRGSLQRATRPALRLFKTT
jgi:hypothetical protein